MLCKNDVHYLKTILQKVLMTFDPTLDGLNKASQSLRYVKLSEILLFLLFDLFENLP